MVDQPPSITCVLSEIASSAEAGHAAYAVLLGILTWVLCAMTGMYNSMSQSCVCTNSSAHSQQPNEVKSQESVVRGLHQNRSPLTACTTSRLLPGLPLVCAGLATTTLPEKLQELLGADGTGCLLACLWAAANILPQMWGNQL